MGTRFSGVDDLQWVPCLDADGAVAFAVREVWGSTVNNSVTILKTRNPVDDTPGKMYVILGPEPIAAGAYGRCTFAHEVPSYARYDDGDDTPSFNDEMGPKIDQATLDEEGFGFTCLAAGADGIVWCIQQPRPQATIIRALINEGGDVATSDANFSIDNVTILAPQNAVLRTTPTDVNNVFDFEGDNNGVVVCVWNDNATGSGDFVYDWDCIQMACPA